VTTTAVPTGNHYDKYASGNPIERRLVQRFMGQLDALLPDVLQPDGPGDRRSGGTVGRILEVGTGEGHVAARIAQRYPDASVVGVDLPDDSLAAGWRTGGLAALFADGAALPFPDRSFDLVLAVEVLEHVAVPGPALAEIARVARGPVVLTVPHEPWWRVANLARGKYVRALGNTPGHVNHWSRRGFARVVDGPLVVERVAGSFPWTLVGARVRQRDGAVGVR
jgi:SAM-dependent methyltransferase